MKDDAFDPELELDFPDVLGDSLVEDVSNRLEEEESSLVLLSEDVDFVALEEDRSKLESVVVVDVCGSRVIEMDWGVLALFSSDKDVPVLLVLMVFGLQDPEGWLGSELEHSSPVEGVVGVLAVFSEKIDDDDSGNGEENISFENVLESFWGNSEDFRIGGLENLPEGVITEK